MDADTLQSIGVMIALIGSAVTVFINLRKARPEVQFLDADAATKYSDLVDRAAKREAEYQNRIDTLLSRMAQIEQKYSDLSDQVRTANQRADKFENWAKRLTYQVQSMGGVPVPLEPVAK